MKYFYYQYYLIYRRISSANDEFVIMPILAISAIHTFVLHFLLSILYKLFFCAEFDYRYSFPILSLSFVCINLYKFLKDKAWQKIIFDKPLMFSSQSWSFVVAILFFCFGLICFFLNANITEYIECI